ncbi:phosphate-starvation-inducible PsiE family protein [Mariprofundus ferrooxydans]|uniref:Phosphate-starvation-inducible E n=1 Tax=Mariprofundus ferrooxydans PV-1 TaxID=314345 RepID=Q0EXL7_9PROT|nr:phosphate-starvation-inducible PsiE family protein [Mariprofundus ferrooxydans]EAU54030.1 hypothetical protein SPV1_03298 [Mariprofundus ferrooxydans PV-1]KON46588.1 hypothetical protein AL013_12415 [Mariprofundus ferrooxydans]
MEHIEWAERLLNRTNQFARIIISLALVMATGLITAAFFHDIYLAVTVHPFMTGFMHAIGVLLLLWTMVELINTEVRLLRGGSVDISIFIEVALVVILREIILLPVADIRPTWIVLGKWTGAAFLLGLTYFLVRQGQRWGRERKGINQP